MSDELFPQPATPAPETPAPERRVIIFTDGACIGNPGPGGWACILLYNEHKRELFGGEEHTTNNRMELRAAIEALRALKQPCSVILTTDSEYVRNGITKWIVNWKKHHWAHSVKGQGKQPIKNQDLWQELDHLREKHYVQWQWTKGHATDRNNNRCDQLAKEAAMAMRRKAARG